MGGRLAARLSADQDLNEPKAAFMGTGSQPSPWPRLAGMPFPWLAMAGELDSRYRKTMRDMVSLSENSRLVTIPDAGHNTHSGNPEAFSRALREFPASCR